MGDERPGDGEDARIADEWSVRQFRQPPVIARRQVVARLADLFLDQMVVVEQPFGGGSGGLPVADGACDFAIRRQQDGFVIPEPGCQRQARDRGRGDGLRRGEAFGVLFQPFDAEQFLANGGFRIPRRLQLVLSETSRKREVQVGLSGARAI